MGRRVALKQLSFRMPLRLFFKFIYMYILKQGFRDGRAGYTYCMMQSFFEFQICLKFKELERERNGNR